MSVKRKGRLVCATRPAGLFGVVVAVAFGVVTVDMATAAKNPPQTSRRCRRVLERNLLNLVTVGLRSIASCQRRGDAGRPPRPECNELDNGPSTPYGRGEALISGQVGDGAACPEGDPALAIYPGASTQGLLGALLPAVRRELHMSGDASLAGLSQGLGRGRGARRVGTCRREIAAAHAAVVRKVLKDALRCQRRIDRSATTFGALDPRCLGDAGATGREMAARADRACLGVSAAQAATCVLLPGCLVGSAESTAHTLARFAFPGEGECGNGVIELGEECDDGNRDPGDGCSESCRIPGGGTDGFCGNSVVEDGEECDEGNAANKDDGNCTTQCRLAVCGDGLVDAKEPGVEQCDDGNTTPDDGCSDCEPDGKRCAADGIVANVSFLYEPRVTGPLAGVYVDVGYGAPLSIPGSATQASVRGRFSRLLPDPDVFRVFLVDCDAGNCDSDGDGLDPVRARIFVLDLTGSVTAQVPPGPVGKIRFDCPEGTLVRTRDLPCTLDGVTDASGRPIPPERLQEENIRCLVDSLEGGAATTTRTQAITP